MESKKQNCREIGTAYENKAVLFLQEKGFHILCRNFFCRYGEIDIVAQDGESLVFVEVKYRKNGGMGDVLETVTPAKQRRIIRTARQYLYKNRLVDIPCRFDVIGFSGEALHYIENAFEVTD